MKPIVSLSLVVALAIGNQCVASAQHPLSGANKKKGHENAPAPQVAGAPIPRVGGFAAGAGMPQEGQDVKAQQEQEDAINTIFHTYTEITKHNAALLWKLEKLADKLKNESAHVESDVEAFMKAYNILEHHTIDTTKAGVKLFKQAAAHIGMAAHVEYIARFKSLAEMKQTLELPKNHNMLTPQ